MIYCFRFYFDQFPGITDGKKVLALFDRIAGILNCGFDRYFLDIFDEGSEDDRDIVCNRDERSEYAAQISDLFDEKGALRFASIYCAASTYTVPYGKCSGKQGIIYGIIYGPGGMNWIELDIIPAKNGVSVDRRTYAELLRALAEAGISLNNSLAHCSIHDKAWRAFRGGGNFGLEWRESRRIRQAVNRHRAADRKDCLADVYWGNSLKSELVMAEDKARICELVGAENVWESDGQFVFILSDSARGRGMRIRRRALGQMLDKYIAPEMKRS